MKKITSMMGLGGGLVLALAGCATEKTCDRSQNVVLAAPPPPDAPYAQPGNGRSRFWYRVNHRMFNDGYSFNSDPYCHDSLAPTLGLDPWFPPAVQPYKKLD